MTGFAGSDGDGGAAGTAAERLAGAAAVVLGAGDRAGPWLGIRLVEVAPGRAVMSLTVAETMANGHGICHGGLIFSLADSATAFAAGGHNLRAVAQYCTISFLRPARLGDMLTATAEERASAGRSGIYDVQVTRQNGEIVAELRGHLRIMEGTLVPVAPAAEASTEQAP
jgi:acyl-CoA thioesterase